MFELRVWTVMATGLRLAAVAVVLFAGWFAFLQWAEHERASEQRALDGRVFELATRASAPGSALACLDALAGETVEAACEKALFATPETVANAVSYVAAQLTLLAAGHQGGSGADRRYRSDLAQLRRAAERDRFGIVAHVLATREGCTAEKCAAFALLDDASRVSANIAAQTFDDHVKRHASAWSDDTGHPAATSSLPGTVVPAPVAGVRNPNNLFFPSAASIPPVSIMNAEPGATSQDTTGSTEAKPVRKPPSPPTRPAANANAAPAAPLPLAPDSQ